MPRLKNSTYLERRRFLNYAWNQFKTIYGAFRFAYEHSNGDLIQFHRAVQQLTPNRYVHVTTVRRGAATAERRIRAVPIMNRSFDAKLLAKALLMQLEHEASKDVTDQTDRAA